MATGGGSVAAAIFWMKARAGWREKQEVTVSAEAGMAGVMIYLPHNGRDELPPEQLVSLGPLPPGEL